MRHSGTLPLIVSVNVDTITTIGIILVATSILSLMLNEVLAVPLRIIVKESPDKETSFRALHRLMHITIYFIGVLAVVSVLIPGGIGVLTAALMAKLRGISPQSQPKPQLYKSVYYENTYLT